MSDQCGRCEIKGNLDNCLREDCFQHDNWFTHKLQEQIADLKRQLVADEGYPLIDCIHNLNFQLTEKDKEIERLSRSQHDENCDSLDIMIPGKPCNCYLHYKEWAEKAEAELERWESRYEILVMRVEELRRERDDWEETANTLEQELKEAEQTVKEQSNQIAGMSIEMRG